MSAPYPCSTPACDRRRKHVAPTAPVPDLGPGAEVWCRTASDRWVRKVATAPAQYDDENAIGRSVYLTIPVVAPENWRGEVRAPAVNWPAEDVRTSPPAESGR